ncbi:hypothetical protein PINS_up010495 [Pythium insidiosum]|nr:hypothetical protein PINS_up010495 [Pythium insidiosum]
MDGPLQHIRLDVNRASSRETVRRSLGTDRITSRHNTNSSREPQLISWSALTPDQQRLELKAATCSRIVNKMAGDSNISLPSIEAFAVNADVKAQLLVRSFCRWYLSNCRVEFLREELACAALDPYVHAELKQRGCAVLSRACVGNAASDEWISFVSWYATGRAFPLEMNTMDDSSAQCQRLLSRTSFLERRLQSALETIANVRSEDSLHQRGSLFIFDNHESGGESTVGSPSAWERVSPACQQREVALALLDPLVQMAAMADDIELPDISAASLEGFDLLSLAGKFVPWWQSTGNIHRSDFLKRELAEAAVDTMVRDLLAKEAAQMASAEGMTSSSTSTADAAVSFLEAYFQSDEARLTFLKKKLFFMKRKSRIASIAKYGKLPCPIVYETIVRPLRVGFSFPPPPAAPSTNTTDAPSQRAPSAKSERRETNRQSVTVMLIDEEDVDDLDDEEKQRRREIGLMAAEDELSREMNSPFDEMESEEEPEEQAAFAPPKRTDFTRSYFFGSLPTHLHIPTSHWSAGSGIDNGDEEIEEEERLERERRQQEELDRLEAERIAEAERQAERLRIEKEKEEKAFQFRRLRQAEFKRIVAYQIELEAQREREIEEDRMAQERLAMMQEEELERQRIIKLQREWTEMAAEDYAARSIRQQLRDARAREMRRMLDELTIMSYEDIRSRRAMKEQLEHEESERRRRRFLHDVYEPFEPFFPESHAPCEDMMPSIQLRLLARASTNGTTRPNTLSPISASRPGTYTLPFAETVLLDEVGTDVYVVRDSRKLRKLLGLSTATPQSRRDMRIPSELDILATRSQLQHRLVETNPLGESVVEERIEYSRMSTTRSKPLANLSTVHGKRSTNQVGHAFHALPKLRDASPLEADHGPRQSRHRVRGSTKDKDELIGKLPFFRGTFGVKGMGRSRASDYAPT